MGESRQIDLRGLRICFIAGTLGSGGAERQLYYVLRSLIEHDARPSVLTFGQGERWEKPIADLGVTVKNIHSSGGRLGRFVELLAVTRRLRPQIVQAQHFYTNLYAAFVGFFERCPSIGAVRGSGLAELTQLSPLLARASMVLPSLILCNSHAAMSNLVSRGFRGESMTVLTNVVDITRFSGVVKTYGRSGLRILGLGRLVYEKRFDRFLRIVAALRENGLDVCGLIVGSGESFANLSSLRDELGLAEYVKFSPSCSNITPHLQWADVLLSTSDHEGTPNVVMEAAASGLPVVSSSVGDVGRVVDDQVSGFLFRPDCEGAAVQALRKIAEDCHLRKYLGENGRTKMASERAPGCLAAQLSNIYGRLLCLPIRE